MDECFKGGNAVAGPCGDLRSCPVDYPTALAAPPATGRHAVLFIVNDEYVIA